MPTDTQIADVLSRAADHYQVYDGHDYGEFFVHERKPVVKADGSVRYCATWVCYSSFGVYGHHWYSMGEPFAKFVQGVSQDYLLSKIGKKIVYEGKVRKEISRLICLRRREKRITSEVARDAWDAVRNIYSEYAGEVFCHMLYDSTELSRVPIEWCDLDSQDYCPQSVQFARLLWPKFVSALRAAAAEILERVRKQEAELAAAKAREEN